MKKLFTLMTLLVTIVMGAKAQTTLVDINFADETNAAINAGTTTTVDGVGVYSKAGASLSNEHGLIGTGNIKTSNYWFAIPLENIDGSITITLTSDTDRPTYNYYVAEYDALPGSYSNPAALVGIPRPEASENYTVSAQVAVSKSKAVLYFGHKSGGSSAATSRLVVTTGTESITTNAAGWASYTPAKNATLSTGATAYIVTNINAVKKEVTINSVTTLKKGEGYFIKGDASTTYTATLTDAAADDVTGNMLVGCTTATEIAANTTPYAYVLGTQDSKAGLYYVGDKKVTIPAGKCYLNSGITGDSAPLSLTMDFSEVTAVQEVVAAPAANKAEVKKAFVNGQLVIMTENGFVNALGQTVK